MKTTETKIPNLDALVSGINDDTLPEVEQSVQEEHSEAEAALPAESDLENAEGDTTLWRDLLRMLGNSKEKTASTSQKIYKIDSDIVETLSLCNFKGHSVSHVINCILRTYIIANIRNLDTLRRHEPSLFDNYLTK